MTEFKMSKRIIWTKAALEFLFEEVTERFGPYETWEKVQQWPGHNLDSEYHQFCSDFAKVVGAKSGKAVELQVTWPVRELTGSLKAAHARRFILGARRRMR